MVELSPNDWGKLFFFGRVEESVIEGNFWIKRGFEIIHPNQYIRISGNLEREKSFNSLNKILENIFKVFEKNNQDLFTEVKFIVSENGKFDIKFSYDKIEEDDYFSEKFQAWKKEIEKEEFGEQ